jgi:hypothetical protein
VWNIVDASRSQSKLSDTKAEISIQVDQPPILTIPDALLRDHSSVVDSKSETSGCPLSRFIPQEIPEIKDTDPEDSKSSLSIPQEKKAINYDQPTIKTTITNDPYMEDIDILDADSEPDIYADPNDDYDEGFDGVEGEHRFNYQYTNTINPTFPNTNIPFPNNFNPFPHNFNQQVSRHVVEETKKEESDQTSTSKNMLEMDWDENHEARFVKWVMDQKKIRQQEERKLEEGWRLLVNERNGLEEQKRNIEAREAKLSEVKDLIPSAKELKESGIDFSLVNSWLSCVKEMSERKCLDLRTAAWELAKELENCTEYCNLQKTIHQQKQQLSLLNMTLDDQKAAIATLVNLQKIGMSEIEISRLVKLVNGWGKGNGNFANGLELDTHINLPSST